MEGKVTFKLLTPSSLLIFVTFIVIKIGCPFIDKVYIKIFRVHFSISQALQAKDYIITSKTNNKQTLFFNQTPYRAAV